MRGNGWEWGGGGADGGWLRGMVRIVGRRMGGWIEGWKWLLSGMLGWIVRRVWWEIWLREVDGWLGLC